jgi:Protein of unknown function (DUF2510)
MSDPNALPIAGWYPDPENDTGDRWWNGATWSDHRRPRNAPAGWAPAAAAKPKTSKAKAAAGPSAASATAVPAVPVPVAPVTPAPAATFNPYATPDPYAGPPAPAYAPYAPAYAPNYAPPTPMRNPLALGGMITSLVAVLFNFILFGAPGIAGGIVSIFGLRRANQLVREGVTLGNGRVMAITGIAAGFAGALLWNLFYFSVFSPLQFS